MTLYLVFGVGEDDEILNFYGAFTDAKTAAKIRKDLMEANMAYGEREENFMVREIRADEPTREYDFMTRN